MISFYRYGRTGTGKIITAGLYHYASRLSFIPFYNYKGQAVVGMLMMTLKGFETGCIPIIGGDNFTGLLNCKLNTGWARGALIYLYLSPLL